jgi:hypothetical protein
MGLDCEHGKRDQSTWEIGFVTAVAQQQGVQQQLVPASLGWAEATAPEKADLITSMSPSVALDALAVTVPTVSWARSSLVSCFPASESLPICGGLSPICVTGVSDGRRSPGEGIGLFLFKLQWLKNDPHFDSDFHANQRLSENQAQLMCLACSHFHDRNREPSAESTPIEIKTVAAWRPGVSKTLIRLHPEMLA